MATNTLPNTDGIETSRDGFEAHHTISVEPYQDRACIEVNEAVVERYRGVVVCVCCRDVDVLGGATLEQVARRYAQMYEADYVPAVAS